MGKTPDQLVAELKKSLPTITDPSLKMQAGEAITYWNLRKAALNDQFADLGAQGAGAQHLGAHGLGAQHLGAHGLDSQHDEVPQPQPWCGRRVVLRHPL